MMGISFFTEEFLDGALVERADDSQKSLISSMALFFFHRVTWFTTSV